MSPAGPPTTATSWRTISSEATGVDLGCTDHRGQALRHRPAADLAMRSIAKQQAIADTFAELGLDPEQDQRPRHRLERAQPTDGPDCRAKHVDPE